MALSASALSHRYIWGLKGDVRQNIAFHDETTCVYVAGHTVVLYNTLEKRQVRIKPRACGARFVSWKSAGAPLNRDGDFSGSLHTAAVF